MIIYKLIGSAGLVASGIWFYFIREKFQKRKELQFSAYIKLISYIKNQIECYMLPIDAIISECDIELLSECGSVNRASTLVDFLDNSTFYIDEDVIRLLYDFAEDFGLKYYNEQIKTCDRYINELNKSREVYLNQRAKDKKLSLAICLSISFSLILILI
jgi:hypothetical protein